MNDTDISAQEARELAQEVKTFFREGAHDLKNLFHVLHIWIQTTDLEDGKAQTQQHLKEVERHYLSKISQFNEAFDRLFTIKSLTSPVVKVSFQHLVDSALLGIRPTLKEIGGSIDTDFEVCPTITYQAPQLSSTLHALLDNAVLYQAEDRPLHIQVSTKQQKGNMVLTVRDNGMGIDMERYHEQLFAPFQRCTTRGEGRGINLHLVRVMVEQNGGSIALDSQVGEGTTVTLTLLPMKTSAEGTK